MSGKLDQSLDEILSSRRKTAGRGGRGGRRVGNGTKAAAAAPVGGIRKNTRGAKTAPAKIPSGPAAGSGESKIIVSNLVRLRGLFIVLQYLTFLALRCERGPDQGMLNQRPPRVGLFPPALL